MGTLYTYKYEVAINNDKLHRSALSFLSRDLLWNVTFRRVSRGPTCPAGRGTLRLLRTQVPPGDTLLWRTRCWQLARLGDFLLRSEVRGKLRLVHLFGVRGKLGLVRLAFWFLVWPNNSCSLNLDFSCPNMKNSDKHYHGLNRECPC